MVGRTTAAVREADMSSTLNWIAALPTWEMVACSVLMGLAALFLGAVFVELFVRLVWFFEDRG
jgi:hypothetical protein